MTVGYTQSVGARVEIPSFVDWLRAEPDLPEDLYPSLDRLEALVRRLVAQRPNGDVIARDAIVEFDGIVGDVITSVGSRLAQFLRGAQLAQLRGLILGPDEGLSPAKKRALVHVQTGFETLGDLLALAVEVVDGLPVEALRTLIDDSTQAPPSEEPAPPEVWFVLSCAVAIEALRSGTDDDVAFWAVEVLRLTNDVRVQLATELGRVEAVRGRLRARLAWSDWDEEEARAESQSWKLLE